MMNLEFVPISRAQAVECVRWRYEAPYDLYNLSEDARKIELEAMLDQKNMCFAVSAGGEFIGVRSFGDDGKVEGGDYDDEYQDTGGALKPEMTSKGLGEEVLRAGLQFGARRFGFFKYRVTVASFNERALKVCQRVGFVERQRFSRASDDQEFVVLTREDPSK